MMLSVATYHREYGERERVATMWFRREQGRSYYFISLLQHLKALYGVQKICTSEFTETDPSRYIEFMGANIG